MTDPHSSRWGGRSWSPWCALADAIAPRAAVAPILPGIYRVRCSGRTELIYIGESGRSIRTRLRQLRRGMLLAEAGARQNAPHVAAPCIHDHTARGWNVEVSWTSMLGIDKRERRGVEVDLIALYRRVTKASPTCQFAGELEPA